MNSTEMDSVIKGVTLLGLMGGAVVLLISLWRFLLQPMQANSKEQSVLNASIAKSHEEAAKINQKAAEIGLETTKIQQAITSTHAEMIKDFNEITERMYASRRREPHAGE